MGRIGLGQGSSETTAKRLGLDARSGGRRLADEEDGGGQLRDERNQDRSHESGDSLPGTGVLDEYVGPESTALIFTGPKGAVMRRSNFGRLVKWTKLVADLGVPGLQFHDLRHTGNTLASKVPGTTIRDLMQRMGHDNPRAAMIYLHITHGADRAIADALPVEFDQVDEDDPDDDDGAARALVPAGR